jgi:hypothetical protein
VRGHELLDSPQLAGYFPVGSLRLLVTRCVCVGVCVGVCVCVCVGVCVCASAGAVGVGDEPAPVQRLPHLCAREPARSCVSVVCVRLCVC